MNFAIIVAAGKGRRMNRGTNKVFLPLSDKPMIYHTIKKFQDCSLIGGIAVVAQRAEIKKIEEMKKQYGFDKIKKIVEGGKERQESVYNGLMSIQNANKDDVVVIHNGSNPLVKEKEIAGCIKAAEKYGAAVAGFPLKDTIKKVKNNFVEKTIGRNDVYQVQTPQAVRYGLFIEAFENAKKKKLSLTDDVSLVEMLGKKVKVVPCSYQNIKITTQDDLRIAEGLMGKGSSFRIGFGQDSHKFSANKKLVLGGHSLNEAGLEANSDGDIILHALFNAISSAIGEKSLGYYADKMCREGITDSKEYIKIILGKMNERNLKINNIGISIEASRPKLEPYTEKVKDSLSKILKIGKENIGITYTSGEGLTPFGQGKGMQCFAVVTVK